MDDMQSAGKTLKRLLLLNVTYGARDKPAKHNHDSLIAADTKAAADESLITFSKRELCTPFT